MSEGRDTARPCREDGRAPEAGPGTRRLVGAAGLGVLLSGLIVNLYLAVVARGLSPAEYATFGSFWAIALVLGFGAFLPLEQQLAHRLALVEGRAAVLRAGATAALVLAAAAAVVLAALSGVVARALDESLSAFLALVALCVVSAVQFLLRGILIGTNRLVRHGAVMVLDALVRLGLAVVVLLLSGSAAAFCWALVAAIALAHVPLLPAAWRRAAGTPDAMPSPPGVRGRDLVAASVPLLVGSACAQLLLNGLPVLVVARAAAGSDQAAAGVFVAAFALAKAPLSVVVPLQSAVVPALTRLLAAGRRAAVLRLLLRGAAVLAALAAVGVPLAAAVGPTVVRVVFGPDYRIGGSDLALLIGGVLAYVALVVLTQVHVARGRHRDVAVGWAAALVGAAGPFLLLAGTVRPAEVAFLVGSLAGAVVSGLLLLTVRSSTGRAVPTTTEPAPGPGTGEP